MRTASTLTALILSVSAISSVQAQQPAMSREHDGADPKTFVTKAAQGGLAEVEFAKVARATSQDPKIKQFAEHMLADHGKANDELKQIAGSKGLQVPTELDPEHQAVLQKLSHEKGKAFDTAYSKQMQTDHEKTISLFRGAEQSSDKDLAAFAKKTLPTLTEHEKMANSLPGATRTANAQP